ncbi:hypothetical protein [Flavilitoribacter nigricans]|uniref:Uncharacterized protein n=1 Tax=Flavilitoribacter nigricans (strain ATCC 23147 / DSM 23189 / NBRC 102662 / NCIMB 1420 / SS-2) TaxID=1122177 RepID=A0A2D0MWY9_FLAN2|nr:hypothetical protein [Flavilitoribacter nigricans]PHN00658.1 hypothetical protein CRP01_41085 [Flavilitoribacter nigricans DSM 23189 = NBRC 102662]
MRRRQYQIGAPGQTEYVLATYEDGELHALEGIHRLGKLWEDVCINAPIPLLEKDIPTKVKAYDGMVTIEPIKGSSTGEKIAMFCAAYQKYTGVKYRKGYGDPKLIAGIDITPELLDLYFKNTEWWGKQPKHIRNLVKNYNALLQLQAQPTKKAKAIEFPDEWDKSYESKLKGAQLSAYWKHLRERGLKPQKDAMGNTIKWIKVSAAIALVMILLASCMTPKRVQNYLAKNPQLLPAPEVDTVIETFTLTELDTIYLPEKQTTTEWEWTWGDATDQDSIWHEGSVFDLVETQIEAKDILEITETGHQRKTRFKVVTTVKRDTLYLPDTILVDKPVIKTRTVLVKPRSWTAYIPWGLAVLVLIALLWRKR